MQGRVLVMAALSLFLWQSAPAMASHHHHHATVEKTPVTSSKRHGRHGQTEVAHTGTSRHHRGHGHEVVVFSGAKRTITHLLGHHMRHHGRGHEVAHQPKTRYAYPLGFFLASPPSFDQSGFPADLSASIRSSFMQGLADNYPPRSLVKAGIVAYHPLRGGIFWRRESIKYVIVHSTEDRRQLTAPQVIESWSSMGRRHPGAQYVIERDGTIYQSVDPDLGSVHINIFKTLPGINNDNSVGIEMVHMIGAQEYPEPQVASLTKLVTYLQGHYHVPDENVITHRYAQRGDHTDPVNFQWERFIADKGYLQQKAAGLKVALINNQAVNWQTAILPLPEAFLELHRPIRLVPQAVAAPPYAASKLPASAATATKTFTTTTTNVGSSDSYVKLQSESVSTVAAGQSVAARPKVEIGPAPMPASTPAPRKIPLSLPLRGPIELDPAAVNLLQPAVQPAVQPGVQIGPAGRQSMPFNNGLPGAPVPSGRQ